METQYLRAVRLVDELRACHDRLDHDAVAEHHGFLRSRMTAVVEAYGGADIPASASEGASSPALRRSSIAAAREVLQMTDRDRGFLANHLIPSGLFAAVTANADVLLAMAATQPEVFPTRPRQN